MARDWTVEQRAAIDLRGKTLLVSAAAGSGKTSVLTERIIQTLLDKEHPTELSRILVVTFTRAAAAELKARIAKALTDALAENPSDAHLSRQLLSLGSAQISTIDSFFQKIVRSNFETLGIPAAFRIADENELSPLANEILDGLLEDFYKIHEESTDDSDLMNKMQKNRFASALDHLMSNRSDGRLNATLLSFWEGFSSYPEGIELLRTCADRLSKDAEREFFRSSYGQSIAEDLFERFTGFCRDLAEIRNSLLHDPDTLFKCEALLESDLDFCTGICACVKNDSYEQTQKRLLSFFPGRFPTIRNKPDEITYYQNWRKKFRKTVEEILQPMLSLPVEVISAQMKETAGFCETIYSFYSEFEKRFFAEKSARGILGHNDIRFLLYRLLCEQDGSASSFAQNLSAQYDAVYIDEYQDVDLIQDRIFALIGTNKRFMVGDIKQSIYGFRGSDPSIFSAYRRKLPLYTDPAAQNADGCCVFMSDNFRCDDPVIRFTNQVCSFLFSACEKTMGYREQDDLRHSKKAESDRPTTPVQVAVFEKVKAEEDAPEESSAEAVWIASEISSLLRSERLNNGRSILPSDIAILVRYKSHGTEIAKELQALGIPVASEAAQDLLHDELLTDVMNLLRAVDNPYRDIPLMELLISPLCGFRLEEISLLREASDNGKALFDALTPENAAKISEDLQNKVTQTVAWLSELQRLSSVLPADRFLRTVYLDARLANHASSPALLFLYEQARVYQKSSWCGLYGFLGHMDRLMDGKQVSAAGFAKAENAVTIMTIHHSKGLEFPVVFVASSGSGFNRTDMNETLLYHPALGCSTKLYHPQTGETQSTILREAVRRLIDRDQTEECIRTLYVALTRARERLYVTGTIHGKWENAISNACMVRRNDRGAILGCNSFLSWILAALQENAAKKPDFPCIFQHFLSTDIQRGVPLDSNETADSTCHSAESIPDPIALRYAGICRRFASYAYPLEALRGLPTKAAASKITENLLDHFTEDEDDAMLEKQIELMRSSSHAFDSILSTIRKPTAADIGTATHAFLQFCDYDALCQNGFDSECERLLQKRFLSEHTVSIIHREQIEHLLQSELMTWIRSASEIRREQTFSLFLPLASLTSDRELASRLGDQQLFVQGSIDLILSMPDGTLILVDYKTDAISQAEQNDKKLLLAHMREKHGRQLEIYSIAVRQLFGKAPDKMLLYSLPLGEVLDFRPNE